MEILQRKWDLDYFMAERQAVLAQWPTGRGVDLEEALAYHRGLPVGRNAARALAAARAAGRVLIQPRAGVALIDEQIELLRFLQDHGSADLLPSTIDSYTRNRKFAEAEAARKESLERGRSMLNGFPSVSYGVKGCRQVVDALERPLIVRTATPDFRLGAEIMLAAGYTGHSHGAMGDLAYSKDTSMEEIIYNWQYVDRLAGYYEDNGCPVSREHYIPLCSVVPPGLQIVVTVIDGLLQMGQGANHCLLAYGQNGSLYQDIAALRVMREMGEEYAARLRYTNAVVTTSLHQWMGGFPEDEAKAYSIICAGAAVAAWGGASMTIVKTPDEAFGVPTREANVQGCIATRTMLEYAACSAFPETEQLRTEAEMLRREVRAVMDRVLELGEGDLARGVVAAFKAGVIDIPFSPNQHNRARVMPVRDWSGAFRYLDPGNIPLPATVWEYHREQVARRGELEGRKPSYNMTIADIYALSKGLPLGAGARLS